MKNILFTLFILTTLSCKAQLTIYNIDTPPGDRTVTDNYYYKVIREREHPGLVLFTSGTSGDPKAAVHDFFALLEKFKFRSRSLRTLNFLLFDHWGGLNTMFHILSNGGVVIATKNRDPVIICELIEKYKEE